MVSTEEKRRLIEQLIDVENKLISSEDIKRQFYDVLLRDTNGGKLYKYRTFDKKGYSLENLKEGTLHCSKPSAFNDPFDCKIGITLEGLYEAKYGEKIKSMEAMLEKFGFVVQGEGGLGCLCTDYKNRMMWSHYADSHTGFCIEYDFSEHTGANLFDLPLPVIYAKDRPIFPWDVVIDNNEDNMQRAQLQIVLSMLMKDNVWEYENEWRIFVSSQKSSEYKMPKVSCIYLGVAISEENRTKILGIASELNIPVKQMKVDRGVYDLHAEKVKNI